MKKIYLAVLISFLLFYNNDVKSESVSLYGFKPASVDSLPTFKPKNKPIQLKEAVFVRILAEIDKKGKLKSLKPEFEKDSLYLYYVESYVGKLSFKPAKLNNKKINSILPIEIVFSRMLNSPIIKVPLLHDTLIVDNDLFELTSVLNNVQLPKVINFPPYFSDVDIMDSTNRYPFIIEKISYLKGEISKIENYMSTYDKFIPQIQSAILYNEMQLPKIKNKAFSDDIYLMVSFFQQLSYPVAQFDGDSTYSDNLLHKSRVRLINRFSQLLSEPIPKRIPSDKYSIRFFGKSIVTPVDIFIKIDTTGKANALRAGTSKKNLVGLIRSFVSKLRFFPAINQKNELVEFDGYLRIEPGDKLNIRISYLWMK